MDPHLLLAAAEAIGPAPIAALLAPDLDPERALREPPPGLPNAALRRLQRPDELAVTVSAWLERSTRLGWEVLTPASQGYPGELRPRPLRPLVLFARGELASLRVRTALAVVGSRTPTPYGSAAAEDFTRALVAAGVVLWSGLAYGIDAIAHRTATEARVPTIAVLAGGLDTVYPATHRELADTIVATGGVLLSEAPPGTRATRGHFPRRNRILAAATRGVLVVEAGEASGSLITARAAAECGVDVFAVPGPYGSPRSRGCHKLIAEGAGIACDPEHLLRELGLTMAASEPLEVGADAAAILRVLQAGPRPKDLVHRESRLERGTFLRAFDELLLAALVRELPGDLVSATRRT